MFNGKDFTGHKMFLYSFTCTTVDYDKHLAHYARRVNRLYLHTLLAKLKIADAYLKTPQFQNEYPLISYFPYVTLGQACRVGEPNRKNFETFRWNTFGRSVVRIPVVPSVFFFFFKRSILLL